MNVIEVIDVSKSYRIYHDKKMTLKERLLFLNKTRYEEHRVLSGISLKIKKGTTVGLIGQNGSGKSTLLKLLTGIIYPDNGEITVKGKVSSLLELGAGFHPDFTGRENIYNNASVFGLTKTDIDGRLDEIVDFAELQEYIDNPVRTYSSGMYMRLAFSVAINVNADILLIDEILAVGDTSFQQKCFEKLQELKQKGITIVLVTHDLGTVERFCTRSIWLENGKIKVDGNSPETVDLYLAFMNERRISRLEEEASTTSSLEKKEEKYIEENVEEELEVEISSTDYTANRFGSGDVKILQANILNDKGERTLVLKGGHSAIIEINYKVNKKHDEYVFGMGFYDMDGRCVYGNNTQLDRIVVRNNNDVGVIRFNIETLPLLTGMYGLNVAVVDSNGTPLDFIRNYCNFNVVSNDRSHGVFSIKHSWEIV